MASRHSDTSTSCNRDGVVGAVLIGGAAFSTHSDTDIDIAWTRLVNDWIHDEFKDHLDRFAPGISLPLGDVEASVKELERAAGLGLRPVLLPDVLPARPYTDPAWEPLWEAAEGLGVPLATHVGPARALYPWAMQTHFTPGQGATTAFILTSLGMAETVCWFACSGVLERHPELKIVMTECSAGWLAWLMHFLDHHYSGRFGNEFLTEQGFAPMKATEAPPSYYIRRQMACTFMDDPIAIRNRDVTGLDCLMWGNDYPHQEGVFPNSQEWVDKQFAGIPERRNHADRPRQCGEGVRPEGLRVATCVRRPARGPGLASIVPDEPRATVSCAATCASPGPLRSG